MFHIFPALAGLATLGLLGVGALGFLAAGEPRLLPTHAFLAVIVGLGVCLVPCILLAYLIAAQSAIRDAVAEAPGCEAFVEEARAGKRRAYPWALAALATTILAVVSGGLTDMGRIRAGWHLVAALLALGGNLGAFARGFGIIRTHRILIARIEEHLNAPPAPSEDPAEAGNFGMDIRPPPQ